MVTKMKHFHLNTTINHLLKGKNLKERIEQENRQKVRTRDDDDDDGNDDTKTTTT
jgi:hypothetical protein